MTAQAEQDGRLGDASLPQEPILKVVVRQSLRVVRVGLAVSVY